MPNEEVDATKAFLEQAAKEAAGEIVKQEPKEVTNAKGEIEVEVQSESKPEVRPVQDAGNQEVKEEVKAEVKKPEVTKEEYQKLLKEFEELKTMQKLPTVKSVKEAVDEVVDVKDDFDPTKPPEIDPYDQESVKRWQEWNIKRADFALQQRLAPLEMTFWNREYELQQRKAAEKFGERFDFKKDGDKIIAMQQNLKGLNIEDAHRILDYDRLQSELASLKSAQGQRASAQVLGSTTASPASKTKGEGTKVILSDMEASVAQKMGISLQDYAKHKLEMGR